MRLGRYKTGEWLPPNELILYDVDPYPAWMPSVHHVIGIRTHLIYAPIAGKDTTLMTFKVELDLPFFLWPFRFWLEELVKKMHAQQGTEDVDMIHYREKIFGRGYMGHYWADHHFCYHKDEFMKHFGPQTVAAGEPRAAR